MDEKALLLNPNSGDAYSNKGIIVYKFKEIH